MICQNYIISVKPIQAVFIIKVQIGGDVLGWGIPRISIGSYDQLISLEAVRRGELYKMDDTDVYIGKDGSLYFVASQEWCDFLTGNSRTIPSKPFIASEDDCPFLVADEETLNDFISS